MTAKRQEELKRIYRKAVRNADQRETEHQWALYLAALWLEDGDLRIFADLRRRPRMNGARLDQELMAGTKPPRQVFNQIRERCADRYALALNRYGLATIDIAAPIYRRMTRRMGLEVLQAFQGVDAADKPAVCVAMAKTWHQFVRRLHAQHGLPTVRAMKRAMVNESDAEKGVVESDDFQTKMTRAEEAAWEAVVA